MLTRTRTRRSADRSGATLVEMAIAMTVLFLVLFGLILGSIGVFRYQQVAQLAREGSRWASVHGATYAREQKKPAATPQDVYEQAIRPRATAMDPNNLSYAVSWDQSNEQYHTAVRNDQVVPVSN